MVKNRLSKILAAGGIASRRACEDLIFAGRVQVNGETVLVPQTMVDPKEDRIVVNGKQVHGPEDKAYYILNKPVGYVCSSKRTKDTRLVIDLFEGESKRLFTVGRLDKNTAGLLIVTNDGHFCQQVIHPSRGIDKEYIAKTNQEITPEHLIAISNGALVEGTFVKPVRVAKVRKGTVKLVIAEGKKREARILLESAGLKVIELTRVRIGGLQLGNLEMGSWRHMKVSEREMLLDNSKKFDTESDESEYIDEE